MGTRYNLVDSAWELTDPSPDIHAMFVEFSREFFWDKLGSVSVKWSKRMTLCAGLCRYSGRGGLCEIVLSEPLLKLRPRKDLVETLLHEMIHAYLFVADGNREHDAHGPKFCSHMHRINQLTGTNITVYHSFHDEVDHYKVHWWKCDGPCQHRPPFFGTVKRSMNRKPGPYDFWFKDHQSNCGGTFIKIKEPENTKNKKANSSTKMPGKGHVLGVDTSHKIDEYFRPSGSQTQTTPSFANSQSKPGTSSSIVKSPLKGQASGSASSHKIGDYFKRPTSNSLPSSSKSVPTATYTPTAAFTAGSSTTKTPKPKPKTPSTGISIPKTNNKPKSNDGRKPPLFPPGSGRNGSRKPTNSSGNTKENKGTGSTKSGSGSNFVRRGGTATAQGSRAITVVTLDDDDDKNSSCPNRGNNCNNGVCGSQVKKPEEKSSGNFVPFSGKGYTLGGGGSSGGPSYGNPPPVKKHKF